MSRGELLQARPQETVETDTGELILYNSYARVPPIRVSGEQQKGASSLKAEGRNKSGERTDVEGIKKIVANIF